jgi:hypothetical protein
MKAQIVLVVDAEAALTQIVNHIEQGARIAFTDSIESAQTLRAALPKVLQKNVVIKTTTELKE